MIHNAGSNGACTCVAMGHRRLSIIDLSPRGNQPMVHEGTGDSLVFNGEIYNFRSIRQRLEAEGEAFLGDSDTEVLLRALVRWGTSCLQDLAGMYAFAFYERRTRRVLLCRDPLGIKPLYVAQGNGSLVVASEVRAVLASGLVEQRVDRRGIATLLAYGAVQEPLTPFEGIEAFPAGSAQWWRCEAGGRVRAGHIERFWNFPSTSPVRNEREACEKLNVVLVNAMREHMIADVPLGVFLSSGIDSTVMAGLARECSPLTRTFTLGFLDQTDLSENDLARATARALRVEHHDIQVTDDQAALHARSWMETLDQPSVDGLNTYMVSKAVRDAGIVVAISGLGGDELFCGYTLFHDVPRMSRMLERTRWMPPAMRASVMKLASYSQDAEVRWKFLDMSSSDHDLLRMYLLRRRAKSNARLKRLGLDFEALGLDETYQDPRAIERITTINNDPVAALSTMECEFYMRNVLLRDTDATSMAHSLEVRVPFLDRRVVELAMSLPGAMRAPTGAPGKHLLRRTFDRFLSDQVRVQPKRGFVLPISRWMRTTLRDVCEESIRSLGRSGLIDAREVSVIWNEFLAHPESRKWSRAFQMCALGAYLSRNERSIAPRRPSPARVA